MGHADGLRHAAVGRRGSDWQRTHLLLHGMVTPVAPLARGRNKLPVISPASENLAAGEDL